ncbi:MAG TPA: efflux RND transporter periplasmic adaptor subunit [Caulobacteraceae bacterium]|jgi:RND family efflux transporter MFP subunit|nr:efflux RND transporter periplasmic adaptor subunit [Caulobacteraceae bacterium]
MTRPRLIALALAALVLVAVAALVLTHKPADAGGDSDATPTASVTTSPIRSETLQDVTTAYGVVQADPAGSSTVAAPRAVIVTRVMVRAGQTVAAGTPLVEVASAPASDLAFRQAQDAVTFAQNDLARVQRLFDAHLAATDQLGAAKKALADARSALAAQRAQGAGFARQVLSAPAAGVVTNVAAAPGDHVAQDGALVALARLDALSAKLGLEPALGHFAAGQAVTVHAMTGGPAIHTRLAMVGAAADPATKTLDAVAPLTGAGLPLGAPVEAEVVTGQHTGLAVPRAAIVFDETGDHVFVIEAGKARRVFVTAGADFGDDTEITGPIAAGQQVAVQGSQELQDGMAVRVVAPAPPAPAAAP